MMTDVAIMTKATTGDVVLQLELLLLPAIFTSDKMSAWDTWEVHYSSQGLAARCLL